MASQGNRQSLTVRKWYYLGKVARQTLCYNRLLAESDIIMANVGAAISLTLSVREGIRLF